MFTSKRLFWMVATVGTIFGVHEASGSDPTSTVSFAVNSPVVVDIHTKIFLRNRTGYAIEYFYENRRHVIRAGETHNWIRRMRSTTSIEASKFKLEYNCRPPGRGYELRTKKVIGLITEVDRHVHPRDVPGKKWEFIEIDGRVQLRFIPPR